MPNWKTMESKERLIAALVASIDKKAVGDIFSHRAETVLLGSHLWLAYPSKFSLLLRTCMLLHHSS